jgi:oxygen-dependent protoporphyrinogen oxidase
VSVVAVVGGGISGLAAAWQLADELPGVDVIVLEAADRLGGKLAVGSVAGVQVDVGAEALLARRPEGLDLIGSAGRAAALITPTTLSAQLRVGGARVALPAKTMFGIPSDLEAARVSGALSHAALARIAAEPDATPLPPLADDVAVGALVRERLGNEIADRLVEPLLGGVYAGRADALSLRATMPALAERLTREGGSLVAAAHSVTDVGTRGPSADPMFVSLTGGLGTLPGRLADAGRFSVLTGTTVRAIRRTPDGFALDCGPVPDSREIIADAVVLATPAAKTGRLLGDLAPAAAAELGAIDSASVAIITLAYRDAHVPEGSGLLIGLREGFTVKAVTLSSQKWPIETGGLTVLRASVGRAGEAHVLQRDDAELTALVRHELRSLIDLDGEPVDALVTRWGGGLPQYGVGHVARVERIRRSVAGVPGLAICGATYDGVGIPACIASARAAVAQIVAALHPVGQ